MHDLRFAFRQLAKTPGFAFVAILTFGLGLGATTAIFSVVYGVLLKPLAYERPDELVVISSSRVGDTAPAVWGTVSPLNYLDWKNGSTEAFAAMAARRSASLNLTGSGEPQRLSASRVTADFWSVFRTAPLHGRVFDASEDEPGKDTVAVLSYALWQRQFGGSPAAIGREVQLNGRAVTIVGVMPPEFTGDGRAELWTPMAFAPNDLAPTNRGAGYLTLFARLKTGVSAQQASGVLARVRDELEGQFPSFLRNTAISVQSLMEVTTGSQRPVLLMLIAAVGALLLIACVNVANLLLARATGRNREISVRSALGASPTRIVRQLLTESLLLAVLGGLLGLALAYGGLKVLLAMAPPGLARLETVSLSAPVFLVAGLIVVVCGIAFGLAPAFQAARVNLVEAMKDGARGAGDGRSRSWLRQVLVISETALALILLVGAGLLMRSFVKLTDVNPGFNPTNAVSAGIALAPTRYDTPEKRRAFVDQLLQRLRALPGVTSVAATQSMPMAGGDWVLGTAVEGRDYAEGQTPTAGYYAVTADYFTAMGIPLVRGRAFTAQDDVNSPRVAIVNQSYVAQHFPDTDPIGQRINMTNGPRAWREIVGVVADVRNRALNTDAPAQMYEPYAQLAFPNMGIVVRTAGPMPGLADLLKREVQALDPDQPVFRITPLEELVAGSVARQKFSSTLLTVFSSLALTLSAIGLYGVMAYAVSQRTAEFGVRGALGAAPRALMLLVLVGAGRLVGAGILSGFAVSFALSRVIESQLFGISARDPIVYAAIAGIFAAVALAACWLPARRAARVDPMVALRAQ